MLLFYKNVTDGDDRMFEAAYNMRKFARIVIVVFIIIISDIIGYFSLTYGHIWGGDFAAYIMQAKSIVNGTINEFLTKNTFTIMNSPLRPGPIAYPWGYPLLLAIISCFWGFNLMIFKLLNIVCFQ